MVCKVQRIKKATLSGSFYNTGKLSLVYYFNIYCSEASFTLFYGISYLVVFAHAAYKTCYVYKYIIPTIFWCNESETFGFVKKFDCSLFHCKCKK